MHLYNPMYNTGSYGGGGGSFFGLGRPSRGSESMLPHKILLKLSRASKFVHGLSY